MKRDILFLAHRLPWPPDRGDKIRSYHVLRYLSERARVHLVTFAEDMTEMASADALRPYVASMQVIWRSSTRGPGVIRALMTGRPASVELFKDRAAHGQVARLLTEEDIGTVYACSSQMAQFVPPWIEARFLMDFVDVDSRKFEAYSRHGPLLLRWLYAREARVLAAYEQAVARRAYRSLLVSESEAALFREMTGLGSRVAAVENGIDLDYWSADADFPALDHEAARAGPLLVFTGQMDYLPNIEAVSGFAQRVLPVLRNIRSNIQFAIVGRNPAPEVERLAGLPGVVVTGTVPDVRPWLAAADVVVAPLTIARGIQNKVLEGMAMARPVVVSPPAAEGIDAMPERDYLVADEDGMTTAILGLLNHPARAAAISQQARMRVEERYRWERCLAALDGLIVG